jgi:hypothetical protein
MNIEVVSNVSYTKSTCNKHHHTYNLTNCLLLLFLQDKFPKVKLLSVEAHVSKGFVSSLVLVEGDGNFNRWGLGGC